MPRTHYGLAVKQRARRLLEELLAYTNEELESSDRLQIQVNSLGTAQQAIECYQQALPVLREVGHRQFEATTRLGLGEGDFELGHDPEAIEFYGQELTL